MQPTKSHVRFHELESVGKTHRWLVNNEANGCLLGYVRWHSPWRRYVFMPNAGTIFDAACLDELKTFCEIQTKAHKPVSVP
jgi:hypothetical protein